MLSKLTTKIKQNPYLTFIFFFSFLLIGVNYVWITKDIAPPPWDQAWYLENSQHLYHTLVKDGVWGLIKSFSHALNGAKAPLISILPLPFYLLLGNSEIAAMFVNFTFLVLLSYFLFRLVEYISDKKVAFLAVLITQVMPLFIGMNRQFFVEYGLATLVVMFLYFLVKSNYFQDKKYNIGLGVVLGLGLLMKILFVLYITFPVLWFVYLRNKQKKDVFKQSFLREALKMAVIGFLIAAVWYIPNIKSVLSFALSVGGGEIAKHYGSLNIFSWTVISGYWNQLILFALSGYYFLLVLVAVLIHLASVLFRKTRKKLISSEHVIFLLIWFGIPFLVFTFGVNKDMRYVLPIMPVISIVIGLMAHRLFFGINNKLAYFFISLAIVFIPVLTVWNSSFIDTSISKNFKTLFTPDSREWKTDEIIDYVYKEMYKQDGPASWNIITVDHQAFNYNTYSYIASIKDYSYPINFGSLGYSQENFDGVLSMLDRAKPSFILIQDGIDPSELAEWTNQANDKIRKMMESGDLPYRKDKVFKLEHGVDIGLYKRTNN